MASAWKVLGRVQVKGLAHSIMPRTKILLKGDFKKQIKDSRYIRPEAAAKV